MHGILSPNDEKSPGSCGSREQEVFKKTPVNPADSQLQAGLETTPESRRTSLLSTHPPHHLNYTVKALISSDRRLCNVSGRYHKEVIGIVQSVNQ